MWMNSAKHVFLENAGWKVGMAIVKDDISVDAASFEKRRRGVAGTVFFHKILGAYAKNGASVEELQQVADELLENVKTIGVAFSGDNFCSKKTKSTTESGFTAKKAIAKSALNLPKCLRAN